MNVPIKTVSEANCSENWRKKHRRHKRQQFFIKLSYSKNVNDLRLPCDVKMVRLSPRFLDDDNLVSSFKYIRDELSECILPEYRKVYIDKNGKTKQIRGRADSDSRISWSYSQEKSIFMGIRIEISFEDG
jgi:hypothetical protein